MLSSAAGTEPLRQAEAAVAPQHAPQKPPHRRGERFASLLSSQN